MKYRSQNRQNIVFHTYRYGIVNTNEENRNTTKEIPVLIPSRVEDSREYSEF